MSKLLKYLNFSNNKFIKDIKFKLIYIIWSSGYQQMAYLIVFYKLLFYKFTFKFDVALMQDHLNPYQICINIVFIIAILFLYLIVIVLASYKQHQLHTYKTILFYLVNLIF